MFAHILFIALHCIHEILIWNWKGPETDPFLNSETCVRLKFVNR